MGLALPARHGAADLTEKLSKLQVCLGHSVPYIHLEG